MRPSPKALLVIVFALTLAGCGQSAPVLPAETTTPAPPLATPSQTPAPTSTVTPTVTPTLGLLAEPIFSHPYDYLPIWETVTPIPTPILGLQDFRLKAWSEQEAIRLIQAMDEYAYANDVEGLAAGHYDFWSAQDVVSITLQEAMQRYPEFREDETILWHVAFSSAVAWDQVNPDPDVWISSEVESWLNAGKCQIGQLDAALKQFGFKVRSQFEAENLFGDDKPAWVVTVNASNMSNWDGVVITIRELGDGQYQVEPLFGQWVYGYGFEVEVGDHNKNGFPEIVIRGDESYIFEWNGNKFVDVVDGRLRWGSADWWWDYGEEDENGIPMIVYKNLMWADRLFVWNGKAYKLSGYLDVTLPEILRFSDYESREEKDFYSDRVNLIKEVMASDEAQQIGNGFLDYLQYRLGVEYAMRGEREMALAELQTLINSPKDTTRTLFPALARQFIEDYRTDMDIYRACRGSEDFYWSKMEAILKDDRSNYEDVYQEVQGFPSNDPSHYMICDADKAFQNLLLDMVDTEIDHIPAVLTQNGVKVKFSRKLNVDFSGDDEWIIYDDGDFWIIFSNKEAFQGKRLVFFSGDPVVDVKIEATAGQFVSILYIRTETYYEIYGVMPGLDNDFLVTESSLPRVFEQENGVTRLQFIVPKPEDYTGWPPNPWEGYRWNSDKNTFTSDLVEYILFQENDPEGVISLLKIVLPLFDTWGEDGPKLSYLLGLAYEVTGDEANAVQTYWTLWRKYPESPYAVMARYKLEPLP